jgi:hypothetical protein
LHPSGKALSFSTNHVVDIVEPNIVRFFVDILDFVEQTALPDASDDGLKLAGWNAATSLDREVLSNQLL